MADYNEGSFVRDTWYMAARSNELDSTPLGRVICNDPIVMFRESNGKAFALYDRCAHRRMPLSKGMLIDDVLTCCYHGLGFDGTGACVRVPGLKIPPVGIKVRSYPLVERYKCLWIWPGDPERADESLIPNCQLLDDPSWKVKGQFNGHLNASYMLMNENLCDLSHVNWLHSGAAEGRGNYAYIDTIKYQVRQDGPYIDLILRASNIDPPPWAAPMKMEKIDFWIIERYTPPSVFWTYVGVHRPGTEGPDPKFLDKPASGAPDPKFHDSPDRLSFYIHHMSTPETDRTCHYFQATAVQWDPAYEDTLEKVTLRRVIDEDVWALEIQQRAIDDTPNAPVNPVHFDSAVGKMHRSIASLLEREV